jgi:hypothetical protein
MTIWIISGVLGFVAGGAFIWFLKPKVQAAVVTTNTVVNDIKKV